MSRAWDSVVKDLMELHLQKPKELTSFEKIKGFFKRFSSKFK